MNACSSRCGWCGACDDGLRNQPEPEPIQHCDACGQTLGLMTRHLSLQGVGVACSVACMDALVAKHEAAMQPRKSA